jgi:uncharacterized Zn finger protein
VPNKWGWKRYVPVAEQWAQAQRQILALEKTGRALVPVLVRSRGNAITRTFWGTAWCKNLESYSDFANRLPRGRTYVRHGRVVHLDIIEGSVHALVRGSALYEVTIGISPVPDARWWAICKDSAAGIDSLVELLQGRFSKAVMERFCRQESGLFPAPSEITLACSCPDWASMCKHVSAVLYGVGARLDEQPELLFRLRQVDEKDLIAQADGGARLAKRGPSKDKVLLNANLAELFGLPMAAEEGRLPADPIKKAPARRRSATQKKQNKRKGTTARAGAKRSSPRSGSSAPLS